METEIEAKWLNINIDLMRKKLKTIGAQLVHSERQMKRCTFDFPDKKLHMVNGWVRVRDEGDKVTLSYKQLDDRSLHGTKEVTVVVDSFDQTIHFLKSIGMEEKSYQETKRESWKLGKTEIELDTWPWIPSFIEIEAKSEKELQATAHALSLDYSQALHGSVETAYQDVYDVTDAEIDSWTEIKFGATPEWLLKKRIVKK